MKGTSFFAILSDPLKVLIEFRLIQTVLSGRFAA
jgi:hypothetical protein